MRPSCCGNATGVDQIRMDLAFMLVVEIMLRFMLKLVIRMVLRYWY